MNKQNSTEENGSWVSIVEYSSRSSLSISTIRRHIKSNRILWKMEDGRYKIWLSREEMISNRDNLSYRSELFELRKQLGQYQKEVEELKMLLSLYERNNKYQKNLPELPI